MVRHVQNCVELVGSYFGSAVMKLLLLFLRKFLGFRSIAFISLILACKGACENVMSDKILPVGQESHIMTERKAVATSSEDAALADTLDLTASVPNWSVADYCARHGRLIDARRLGGMFLDG